MDPSAVRDIEIVVPEAVVIGNNVHPRSRSPLDLPAQSFPRIGRPVRLPSVDEPRLNLQVRRGEDLNSQAIEKPRRVRRNIGRLVSPVIKVVIAEKPDIRHENSRVDVDPVQRIDVITAVSLPQIAIGSIEIPLALRRARIVARRGRGIHAKLGHETRADIVEMEITAHSQLFQLDFIRPEYLARSPNRIVDWLVEIVVVGNISANLRREELRIEGCVLVARVPVQPGPVPIRKRRDLLGFRRLGCRRLAWRYRRRYQRLDRGRRFGGLHYRRRLPGCLMLLQLFFQLFDPLGKSFDLLHYFGRNGLRRPTSLLRLKRPCNCQEERPDQHQRNSFRDPPFFISARHRFRFHRKKFSTPCRLARAPGTTRSLPRRVTALLLQRQKEPEEEGLA